MTTNNLVPCNKCDGTGIIPYHMDVHNGVCFQCKGRKVVSASVIEAGKVTRHCLSTTHKGIEFIVEASGMVHINRHVEEFDSDGDFCGVDEQYECTTHEKARVIYKDYLALGYAKSRTK